MTRSSTRDYKRNQKRPLELWKMREFGMGALVGIILAGSATVYIMNARQHDPAHEKAEAPRPDPHRKAPTDPEATTTAATGEKYDFYEMLPNFEVVVPEKDKEVKRDMPAAARVERPGVYVLQAGSYRNEADADRVARNSRCKASTPRFSESRGFGCLASRTNWPHHQTRRAQQAAQAVASRGRRRSRDPRRRLTPH